MFLDKFIKKPEPEPEVQHSLKDDEPTMIDEPDHLEITGDYAHWYMLYGRGYTIYQDTDYVYRELIKKSNILKYTKSGSLDIELILNDRLSYKGTSKVDRFSATMIHMIASNKQDIINFGYQPNSKLTIRRI